MPSPGQFKEACGILQDVVTMASLVRHGLISRGRIFTFSVLLPARPGGRHCQGSFHGLPDADSGDGADCALSLRQVHLEIRL